MLDANNTYKKDMKKSDDFIGIHFKEDFKPNYYLSARERADILMADYVLNVWDRIVKLFSHTLNKILSKKDTSIDKNDSRVTKVQKRAFDNPHLVKSWEDIRQALIFDAWVFDGIGSIRSCAPDGEYNLYSSLEVWSKSKIKVKNGTVDKDICATAIAEILEETGYHGRYVESIEFDKDLANGSFYVFIGS